VHNLVLFAIGRVPGLDVPAGGLPAAKHKRRQEHAVTVGGGQQRRRQVQAGERGPPPGSAEDTWGRKAGTSPRAG
jgi:hypothetical protein